jgi:Transglycosylase SLT domain
MDLLSAIATCSLHGDVTLVIAIAMTFSQGNPYAVRNVDERAVDSYALEQEDSLRLPVSAATKPKTRAEAEAQMRSIIASDGVPVVGLLPVPVSWAAQFGRKPTDLFNPCINVSIATAKLSEFEYECGKRGRSCVLKEYASAAAMDDLEQDVLDELAVEGLSKQRTAVVETEEMLRSPLKAAAAEERDRQWGADRLFFVLPSAATSTNSAGAKSGSHEAAPQPSSLKK